MPVLCQMKKLKLKVNYFLKERNGNISLHLRTISASTVESKNKCKHNYNATCQIIGYWKGTVTLS